MKRLVTTLVLCALVAGCAGPVPFLQRPSDKITVERQQFINVWAQVKVLWEHSVKRDELLCQAPALLDPERCAKLPALKEQAKAIYLTVEAKLADPEAEINWANIEKLLGLLAGALL